MRKFILILFCFCYPMLAYASERPYTSINSVINQLGEADEVIHNRNGTSYYTYFTKYKSPQYASPSTQPNVIIAPGGHAIGIPIPQQQIGTTTLILCETTYQVNREGIITDVQRKGSNCR